MRRALPLIILLLFAGCGSETETPAATPVPTLELTPVPRATPAGTPKPHRKHARPRMKRH